MAQAISSKHNHTRGYYHSSSFKMAVLFTVLLGVGMSVLGYFTHYFSRGHLVYGTEKVIDVTLENLVPLFRDASAVNADTMSSLANGGKLIALLDTTGAILGGNLAQLPDDVALLAEGTVLFKDKTGRADYAAKIHTYDDGRRLFVAVDITDLVGNYRFMQRLSLLSIILMVVVILTSFMISTFVVSRTVRIARTAKEIIDTGNLSQRIEIDSHWDDLSTMSMVLNDLLSRIERLVEGVQKVSDNIAHDLRTPLTRLRNNLESLRKSETIAKSTWESGQCDRLLAEADHLLSTFNALLRIGRIEAGKQKHNFKEVHLQQLLHDVVELYEPLAEEKGINILCDFSAATLQADRDLLFQAFANVLDNAIKYSPASGRVDIKLFIEAAGAVVTIADEGCGIPAGDKDKVFDRFYRAEASRHTPGNGLGLSLVAAVADLHKAEIELADNNPGLLFRMQFLAS